ncbi:putative ABC transporter permease protein YurM [Halolactibacillus alkaliphilus]|uniref:Putative ABC transporter permease protein YurM n=1 Tax=Halolactibacillus alkaliphilus TaxID=442899 RepID=A0A511X0A0_9BACI|nr:putative ABC transporter permease protein YurM [Halolactibacillus alkaliphilus]GGN67430.1 putative ABC transporter permease protein YurM [Halolactibacillus alkaliphilus]SFO92109.1 raffinose/stachyose/melibiose transport system permease protein [Halolactibacillus alkaliphilus]
MNSEMNKKGASVGFLVKVGIFKTLRVVFLSTFSLLMIYPLYWLITSSFKTNEEFFTQPYAFPTSFTFENFQRAWDVANLGQAMVNSAIVTVTATILTVFLGALTAYVLSRFTFKLKGFLVVFFLLGMLIPVHSTLVPLFTMMNEIGLLDSYWALILPYTAFELPIAIFLTVAYMSSIPKELEEAAVIDGSGYWGIFFKIMLPLSVPALSTVSILAFLRFWNEFVFALVFINDSALKTLPLSLAIFSDGFSTDYALTMAAMTIAVIPTIIMYLLFQEQIMKGMIAGSVKG